jgi:hypothetical protein
LTKSAGPRLTRSQCVRAAAYDQTAR